MGTHPIPQNYYLTHSRLGTWQSARWQEMIQHIVTDEETVERMTKSERR